MMTLKQRIGRLIFANMPITRFLFDQIRVEINAFTMSIKNIVNSRNRRRLKELRKASNLRVNVACGPFALQDFVNIDLIPSRADVVGWDCRRSLPLAEGAAIGIRVEHFLEHLEPREELLAFLKDCHRVLRVEGILRIIVPDAQKFMQAYCSNSLDALHQLGVPDPLPKDLPTRMDIVNHIFHQWSEHRWGYDFECLCDRLTKAGFSTIKRVSFQDSLDPELAKDRSEHASYSLYVDVVR